MTKSNDQYVDSEIEEMKELLRKYGYSEAHAGWLRLQGMGPYELEYRITDPKQFAYTHGIYKVQK